MRPLLSCLLTVALALTSWACSTSDIGVNGDVIGVNTQAELGPPGILTSLDPSSITAGESTTVTCTLNSGIGFAEETDAVFKVVPSEGITIDGARIEAEIAGTYTVHCEHSELDLTDEEGVPLTVVPAEAASVSTAIEPPVIAVMETTTAICTVMDRFGNVIEGVGTTLSAPEDVSISGFELSSESVGSYDVLCDASGELSGSLELSSAELTVTPAAPAEIEVGVTPELDSYAVGQMVDLYWVIRDAYGNQILGLPVQVSVPESNIEVIDAEDHKYRLLAEGLYPFEVSLGEPNEGVSGFRTLVVDESGPDIVIAWPTRGETVLGEGDFLTVEGQVNDAFGAVTSFEIDGVPVSLEEDGSF